MLVISEELKAAYPGGYIGGISFKDARVSEEGAKNLLRTKSDLEEYIRNRYGKFNRSELVITEPIKSYVTYYKKFKKTYHVLLQLESVINKKRIIPNVNPLVMIMFMAELKNLLLTAGHDLDTITQPIEVRLSRGGELYEQLGGMKKELPTGDMIMEDREGVISTIIYGPDNRTQLNEKTKRVLYTVYAPSGIEEPLIRGHFNDIIYFMNLAAPEAQIEEIDVIPL